MMYVYYSFPKKNATPFVKKIQKKVTFIYSEKRPFFYMLG